MLAPIGHNSPPSILDFAQDTMRELSEWMKERPAISSEDDARHAKLLLDRAKNCAADIEAERDKLVRPLNDQVDEINSKYKSVHNKDSKKPGLLDKVVNELKSRLGIFIKAEEDRRQDELDKLLAVAAAKEQEARAAETKEREAIANANAGELGVDVTQVVVAADNAFAEFKQADRAVSRAESEQHVKIGGGFNNAVSLRNKETLVLVSYGKAITAIGPHEKIRDAILSAAREFRKERGALPDGVVSEITREL